MVYQESIKVANQWVRIYIVPKKHFGDVRTIQVSNKTTSQIIFTVRVAEQGSPEQDFQTLGNFDMVLKPKPKSIIFEPETERELFYSEKTTIYIKVDTANAAVTTVNVLEIPYENKEA